MQPPLSPYNIIKAQLQQLLRGDGDHYAAKIVAAEFKGKTRVQQHQMVYNAMNGKMGTDLHALALNTSAPNS